MSRFLFAGLMLLSLSATAVAEEKKFRSWSDVCAAAEEVIQEGDLVFLDIPNFVFRNVARATKTWASHVGIAFKNRDEKWVVAESTIPFSKVSPLCSYLKRSSEYRFEIKRLARSLDSRELSRLRSSANSMLYERYDTGFDFDSDDFYCSKFVYHAYASIGVEAGRIQTFRDLLLENPGASLTFWKIWFRGNIPWNRRTVTPASQLNDSDFIPVLTGQ